MPTSVQRALHLLDVVAASPEPLSVRELEAAAGIPRSTAHRLAEQLCSWGALDAAEGGYRIGLRLFELGGRAPRQLQLRAVSRPFLEDLHAATGRLVQLAVLDGTDVLYLVRVGRRGRQPVATEIPGRLPATCTALGKALLAHDPAAARAATAGPLPRRTRHSITDARVLRAALADARRDGVAIDREEARLGLVCVAAPILRRGGAPVAAVSATGPTPSFDPEHVSTAVRACALGIGRALR